MTHAAVALVSSIHRFRDPARPVVVHAIVDRSVGDEVSKLQSELESSGFDIRIIRATASDHLLTGGAICLRLLLPRYLPSVRRLLYLDADTIVRCDLAPLHDIDLDSKPLAAMPDYALNTLVATGYTLPYGPHRVLVRRYIEEIVQARFTSYFNSGVMVIDLDAWRVRDIGTEALRQLAADPQLCLPDQDVLNRVIGEDYIRIDPRWNAFSHLDRDYGDIHFAYQHDDEDLARVRRLWADDAWIVHFADIGKPWLTDHAASRHEPDFWANLEYTRVGKALRQKLLSGNRDSDADQDKEPTYIDPTPESHASALFRTVPPRLHSAEEDLPLLSVIVTNHNYARFLKRCVESIVYQDYPLIECIIIDDYSQDESRSILAELGKRFPSIRICLRRTNAGQSASALDGYRLSRGTFLAFVDADDYLLPGFASTHIHVHL